MARRELTDRLNEARAKQKGCSLTPADVVEIVDSVLSMALVITQLNTKALAIGIPPEALADSIQESLCITPACGELIIGATERQYYIHWRAQGQPYESGSFLDIIDLWRRHHGKEPMTGVQITIPGTVLYDQLVAASAQPGSQVG